MSNCVTCWQSNPYGVYDWERCEECEEPACSSSCLEQHKAKDHGDSPTSSPKDYPGAEGPVGVKAKS